MTQTTMLDRLSSLAGRRPGLVALAAMVLGLPALWSGFQVDDYFHRGVFLGHAHNLETTAQPLMDLFTFVDGDPVRTQAMMDRGFLPWWTLKTADLSFFRPVTALTHWLDYYFWPETPMLMHLQSLLWYGLLVLVAGRLYRSLSPTLPFAGLALLLFAVDHTHALPISWLANRNALISTVLGVLTVLWYRRGQQTGKPQWTVPAALSLLLGLLANEGTVAACAYLFAHALFLDQRKLSQRMGSLIPYAVIVLGWRWVYNALGFGVTGSRFYIDPLHSPLDFIKALTERPLVLFLGQWTGPPSDFHIFLPSNWRLALMFFGVLVLCLLIKIATPVLRKDHTARFWALGMALSLIPVSATFPNDRLLLFSGLGAFGLMARLIAFQDPSPLQKRAAQCLLILHLILAPILLPARILILQYALSDVNHSVQNADLPEDLSNKTVIILNGPSIFHTSHFTAIHQMQGGQPPQAAFSLAPVLFEGSLIRRINSHTLEVTPQQGYPWFLCRDNHHPFQKGDVVQTAEMKVEVMSVDQSGKPQTVRFHFKKPLEDPSYLWLEYRRRTYDIVEPPAQGAAIHLKTFLPGGSTHAKACD